MTYPLLWPPKKRHLFHSWLILRLALDRLLFLSPRSDLVLFDRLPLTCVFRSALPLPLPSLLSSFLVLLFLRSSPLRWEPDLSRNTELGADVSRACPYHVTLEKSPSFSMPQFLLKWHSNSTCLTALLGINHHVWTFWSLRISRQVSGWLEVYQVLRWEWGLEKRRENTKPSSQEKSLKGQSTAWEQGRWQVSFAGRVLPVGVGRRGVQAVEGRGIRRETIRLEVFFLNLFIFLN